MRKLIPLLLAGCCCLFQTSFAQNFSADTSIAAHPNENLEISIDSLVVPQVRKSPMSVAKFKSNNIYIKVVYGQPYKKGRKVFGELEQYGKVWRTGANEATEITLTKDVKINGKPLKAGTYTLFSIPNPDKWTIIFNSELGQWGAYEYNPEKDVLSFDVPVGKTDGVIYEAFTIDLRETASGADMTLLWDTIKVAIPLSFDK